MTTRADDAVRRREAHNLQVARHLLLSHPAVSSGVVTAPRPGDHLAARLEAARPALRSLFDEIVRRNAGVGGALARRAKPRDTIRTLRSVGGVGGGKEMEAIARRWPARGMVADSESARAVEKEVRIAAGRVEGRRALRSRSTKAREEEEKIRQVRADAAVRGVRGPVAAAMVRAHVVADREVLGEEGGKRGRRKGPGVSAIEVGVLVAGTGKEVRRSSKGGKRGSGASLCCFCPDPSLFGCAELESELLGPFVNPKGQSKLNVHFDCACWAPQVYVDAKSSRFQHVYDEYLRGRHLRCAGCSGRGATVGCYVEKCKKTFHFRCLGKAGARKVENYFVSFCSTHRHLADTTMYQLMMEAGSIADVASVIGRDSTMGLDTPHSKHTQLRRGETEVIFSARARLSSHAGAFEAERIVFATRRREIVSPTERLVVKDRPRRIRGSAFDVASARLTLLDAKVRVTATGASGPEAEAEVAALLRSVKLSPLFLLRNLEKAPDWSPDEIDVVKVGNAKKPLLKRPSSSARDRTASAKKRRLESAAGFGEEGHEGSGLGESGRRSVSVSVGRRIGRSAAKRARIPGVPMEDVEDEDGAGSEQARPVVVRLALSREGMDFVGERRVAAEKKERAEKELRDMQERKTREREERAIRRQEKEAELRRKREVDRAKFCDNSLASSPVKPAVIKTAWQIFLDEQLPKERVLRPDDDPKVSMRNMARLWGLLEPLERAVYVEKSKVPLSIGLSPFGSKGGAGDGDTVAAAEAVAVAAADATRKIRGAPRASRVANRVDAPTGVTQKGASSSAAVPPRMSTRRTRGSAKNAGLVSDGYSTPEKGNPGDKRDDFAAGGEAVVRTDNENSRDPFVVGFFAHPKVSHEEGRGHGNPSSHRAATSVSLPSSKRSRSNHRESLDSIFPEVVRGDDEGSDTTQAVRPPPPRSRRSNGSKRK